MPGHAAYATLAYEPGVRRQFANGNLRLVRSQEAQNSMFGIGHR